MATKKPHARTVDESDPLILRRLIKEHEQFKASYIASSAKADIHDPMHSMRMMMHAAGYTPILPVKIQLPRIARTKPKRI